MDKLVEASKAEPSTSKADDCSAKPKKKCRYNAEIGEYEELYRINLPNPWDSVMPIYYERMENWRRSYNAALQAAAIASINDVKKSKRDR